MAVFAWGRKKSVIPFLVRFAFCVSVENKVPMRYANASKP